MDLLTHLQALCAVADHRSFTRAAQALGVPQPVVSRRVAALERHLGGRLLVRDPRGVTPTELGRTVLPLALDLRVRADHLHEVAAAATSRAALWLPEPVGTRALVGVREAARDTGLDLDLVAAPPRDRRRALDAGPATLALLPCAPDDADVVLPLSVGVAEAGTGADQHPSRWHVDSLRVHRGDPGPTRRLHLGPEDDQPWVRDVVRRRAARAGLAPHQVVVGTPVLTAVADVLGRGDVWLCTPAEAGTQGLEVREPVDFQVRRGLSLVVGRAGSGATSRAQREDLLAALAPALGGEVPS